MLIDFEAVDRLKFELLDLSTSLSNLSTENESYFKDLLQATERVKHNVFGALDTKGISRLGSAVEAVSKKSEDFSSLMSDLGKNLSGSANLSSSFNTAAAKFKEVSDAISGGDSYIKESDASPAKRKKDKDKKKPDSLFMKELKGIRGVYQKSIEKPLKLPSVGNVAATGIMWMAFGVMDEQRLKAMLGRAKNTIISAVDGMVGETVKRGSTWLRDFAEAAQKFYAVSEQEVMNLGKVFTEAGFSIEETILKKIGPDIRKGLHGNFASLTLGLDKVFELAGGTMAKKAVDYAQRYGVSLESAYGSLEKMAALGRGEDGVGSMFFMKNVERSLTPLEKMGYNIENVVELFDVMQKHFTKAFGVPKHLSAKAVGEGIQQITEGMGSMSMDWQVYLAKSLGYGKGDPLEARIELMDNMQRLAKQDNDKFAKEIVKIVGAVQQDTGGNDALVRTILEKGPNWGIAGSRLAMELFKYVQAGGSLKAKDIKAKVDELKSEVVSSLDTEKEKMMGMEIAMNEWMAGMREVGISMLGLLGNALASLIANVKAIPSLLIAAFKGEKGKKDAAAIHAQLKTFSDRSGKHIQKLIGGLGRMAGAGEGMFNEALGDTLKALKTAIFLKTDNASSKNRGLFPDHKAPNEALRSQVVMIPVASNSAGAAVSTGEFDVPMPEAPKSGFWDQLSGKAAEDWVGGKIVVRSYGVDEMGGMLVGVTGSCPRCGLKINPDAPEVSEVAATSLLGAEETSGKAGSRKKKKVQPSSVFGAIQEEPNGSAVGSSVPSMYSPSSAIVPKGTIEGRFRYHRQSPGAKHGDTHSGIDISAKEGTVARAPQEGTVIHIGQGKKAGKHVQILHPSGKTSWWMHMQSIKPKVGQKISKGEEVGRVGATGYTKAPHIHLEVLKPGVSTAEAPRTPASSQKNFGLREDPMLWLKDLGVSPIAEE